MVKKYKLIDANGNSVLSQDEIDQLKEKDFVFLIFYEEDNTEERLWVRISKVGKDNFEGIVANEPAFLKTLKSGDTINFERKHIVNYSTKEEQERIVAEFQKTGRLPRSKKDISFDELKKLISELLAFAEKYKREIYTLYKIKKIDRIFYQKNIEDLEKEYKESERRAGLSDTLVILDMEKMLLSLIFIVIVPQISEKIEEGEIVHTDASKAYYRELFELLEFSSNIYNKIPIENLSVLAEIRQFFMDEDLDRISQSDLPGLFNAFLGEIIESIGLLQ